MLVSLLLSGPFHADYNYLLRYIHQSHAVSPVGGPPMPDLVVLDRVKKKKKKDFIGKILASWPPRQSGHCNSLIMAVPICWLY